MERLWAPWRMEYILAEKPEGCIFCGAETGDAGVRYILHRTRFSFVMLNRYPYTNGHLLVAPYRHTATMDDLDDVRQASVQIGITRDNLNWTTVNLMASAEDNHPGVLSRLTGLISKHNGNILRSVNKHEHVLTGFRRADQCDAHGHGVLRIISSLLGRHLWARIARFGRCLLLSQRIRSDEPCEDECRN